MLIVIDKCRNKNKCVEIMTLMPGWYSFMKQFSLEPLSNKLLLVW